MSLRTCPSVRTASSVVLADEVNVIMSGGYETSPRLRSMRAGERSLPGSRAREKRADAAIEALRAVMLPSLGEDRLLSLHIRHLHEEVDSRGPIRARAAAVLLSEAVPVNAVVENERIVSL
jgi:hypothetical protein